MRKKTLTDLSEDAELQILLERLNGQRVPSAFGDQLAEKSVEKFFPKW